MTRRWAVVGLVVSALVFLSTLLASDADSSMLALVKAASVAAGIFFWIWFFAPLLARLTRRARLAIANATGHSGRRGA